jgi:lysophospholipase L1-like esterase
MRKLAVILGAALVVSACMPPSPTPAPPSTTTIPAGKDVYVAMGDSYSSGWGIGGYDNSKCGRSVQAYPEMLVDENPNLHLIFVACGGADTRHIIGTSLGGEIPQAQHVTAETDLVTMTIGGNDAALIWMLDQCVKAGNCITSDFFGNNFIGQMNTKIKATTGKVVNAINVVLARNPNVRIVIAGYPYILPAEGQSRGSCSKWLREDEQAMFADATRRTNAAIQAAVQQVNKANVVYADPMTVFPLGKDGCSTDPDKYMFNYEIPLSNGGWHPNTLGQQLYRQLFAANI